MSVTQREKAVRFSALHERPGAFLIPNPWDVGSARVLAGLGFEALATTSAATAMNRPVQARIVPMRTCRPPVR